jgi:hypothetical protein
MNLKIVIMIALAMLGAYTAWWFMKELTKGKDDE